jgi:hypothetical protein
MFKESIKMSGNINLHLTDEDGNLKVNGTYPNLVVFSGKSYIANRMTSNSSAIMSHLAVGTNTVAAANTDIILNAEISRVALTSATVSSNTITYVTIFNPGSGTGAITEAGIFNSATANGGTMLCRTVFPVVNKESGDTLTITWNVTAS